MRLARCQHQHSADRHRTPNRNHERTLHRVLGIGTHVGARWSVAIRECAEDAPTRVRKGAGRYPQPVALLARLGVSIEDEGRGLGAGLLADAISRTAQLGTEIGCRGLLVHAETPQARDFYLHLIPEIESSPTDDFHLVLLMKDIFRTFRD